MEVVARIINCLNGIPFLLLIISEDMIMDECTLCPLLVIFSTGRRVVALGLAQTMSVNGSDHSEMGLIQVGPVILEISCRALPMLSSVRHPLIAVVP